MGYEKFQGESMPRQRSNDLELSPQRQGARGSEQWEPTSQQEQAQLQDRGAPLDSVFTVNQLQVDEHAKLRSALRSLGSCRAGTGPSCPSPAGVRLAGLWWQANMCGGILTSHAAHSISCWKAPSGQDPVSIDQAAAGCSACCSPAGRVCHRTSCAVAATTAASV